jgi:hypothetical protein
VQRTLCLQGQKYRCDFMVADVLQPIVGVDFLLKHQLLVDMYIGRFMQPGNWSFIGCDRVPKPEAYVGIKAVGQVLQYTALH